MSPIEFGCHGVMDPRHFGVSGHLSGAPNAKARSAWGWRGRQGCSRTPERDGSPYNVQRDGIGRPLGTRAREALRTRRPSGNAYLITDGDCLRIRSERSLTCSPTGFGRRTGRHFPVCRVLTRTRRTDLTVQWERKHAGPRRSGHAAKRYETFPPTYLLKGSGELFSNRRLTRTAPRLFATIYLSWAVIPPGTGD